MNCGNCLMERVKVVPLENGKCPKCGTDYSERCNVCGRPLHDGKCIHCEPAGPGWTKIDTSHD